MNVLVISNCAWDDTNATGNTLSNWFSDWNDSVFTSFYSREAAPLNKCCNSYYVVTLAQIAKNFFTPWRIGRSYDKVEFCNANNNEAKLINSLRGKSIKSFFVFLNELLFTSDIWINRKLKSYIQDLKPDICFTFAIGEPFRYNLCKYLKKQSIPVVLFVADDVYGAYNRDNGIVSKLQKNRFVKMLHFADKVYGASEMMCHAYTKEFGIKIEELYKGCQLSSPKNYHNNPIRITYAGNLFYGRAKTLGDIARILSKINKEHRNVAQLEIYTGTPINSMIEMELGAEGISCIKGKRSYSEITSILKESDIVLHVESFEKDQMSVVRYSFSTKIIDCLQSGSVLMVVGPKGIASVEYPRRLRGSIVIDDLNNLENTLSSLIANPDTLISRAALINKIAANVFPIDKVRERLHKDFNDIVNR